MMTEKRAQVRTTCSILEQYEPWKEPQLNLRHSEFAAQKFVEILPH
jgi:hypothetical protein